MTEERSTDDLVDLSTHFAESTGREYNEVFGHLRSVRTARIFAAHCDWDKSLGRIKHDVRTQIDILKIYANTEVSDLPIARNGRSLALAEEIRHCFEHLRRQSYELEEGRWPNSLGDYKLSDERLRNLSKADGQLQLRKEVRSARHETTRGPSDALAANALDALIARACSELGVPLVGRMVGRVSLRSSTPDPSRTRRHAHHSQPLSDDQRDQRQIAWTIPSLTAAALAATQGDGLQRLRISRAFSSGELRQSSATSQADSEWRAATAAYKQRRPDTDPPLATLVLLVLTPQHVQTLAVAASRRRDSSIRQWHPHFDATCHMLQPGAMVDDLLLVQMHDEIVTRTVEARQAEGRSRVTALRRTLNGFDVTAAILGVWTMLVALFSRSGEFVQSTATFDWSGEITVRWPTASGNRLDELALTRFESATGVCIVVGAALSTLLLTRWIESRLRSWTGLGYTTFSLHLTALIGIFAVTLLYLPWLVASFVQTIVMIVYFLIIVCIAMAVLSALDS